MTTTTPSRTGDPQLDGLPAARPAVARGHLRLVPSGDGAAALARARAAHPAGKGLTRHAPGPAPLRLTARGRLVLRALVVVLMLLVMAVAGLALARGARADGPVPPVVVHTHVVLPGETLWSIAEQVAPGADPRDTVARIIEFNALPGAGVQAGQQLALPPGLPGGR